MLKGRRYEERPAGDGKLGRTLKYGGGDGGDTDVGTEEGDWSREGRVWQIG